MVAIVVDIDGSGYRGGDLSWLVDSDVCLGMMEGGMAVRYRMLTLELATWIEESFYVNAGPMPRSEAQ